MELFAPRHPVRNGAHLDRAQDRLAQPAAREKVAQGTHRLIVAHVLVDGEHDPRLGADIDALLRGAIAHREWFLREDAAEVAFLGDGSPDNVRLGIRRDCDVEHLDFRIGEQVIDRGVAARDAVQPSDGAGASGIAGGDGDGIEAGLSIGDEVTVAHDEAAADATDAEILAARQPREVIEGEVHAESPNKEKVKRQKEKVGAGQLLAASFFLLPFYFFLRYTATTRSSRGSGKWTCSSRTTRLSSVAP